MKVRVRFAPSPTGYLHVGGARTALFNWLFARHHGGKFILRIEDTDQARNSWEAVEQILASMAWLGLAWDEGPLVGGEYGPYFQSLRLDLYRAEVERLVASGHAYRCWCTPEELAAARDAARARNLPPRYPGTCRNLGAAAMRANELSGKPAAIRFRVPQGEAVFQDLLRGVMRFDNAELDDLVIMKSDGIPTYNFAVVVDDTHMEISHVIRGDDHLSNTPRQVVIYEALGYPLPLFVHVPQILGADKTRLSKRHGATSVFEYRNEGILPAAMMCYLARLGWSYDDKTELFTTEELVRAFDLDGLNKTAAVFDREKLDWVNSRYLRAQPAADRARMVLPALAAAGLVPLDPDPATRAKIREIVEIHGERLELGERVAADFEPFFRWPEVIDPEAERKAYAGDGVAARLTRLAASFEALEAFDHGTIEAALRGLATELGVKAKDLIHPARFAATGRAVGAGLFETLAVLGKDTVVERLRRAAERAGELQRATAG